MLETKSFKEALEEAQRLMPKMDIAQALNQNPEIIFSTQRHGSMIPYDAVPGPAPIASMNMFDKSV